MKDAVMVCIGLTIGNFVGEAMSHQVWNAAIDRSYFEVVGIVALMFVQQIGKVKK